MPLVEQFEGIFCHKLNQLRCFVGKNSLQSRPVNTVGAQLKIGFITLAHHKCTGWGGRLTHSSGSVMTRRSLGLESNAHSANLRHEDATLPADPPCIGLHSDVSKQDRLILWLRALRFNPTRAIIYASRAALPQRKVCIT